MFYFNSSSKAVLGTLNTENLCENFGIENLGFKNPIYLLFFQNSKCRKHKFTFQKGCIIILLDNSL